MNQTKTSLTGDMFDATGDLLAFSDKDIIAQDDRETSTDDFRSYLKNVGLLKLRDKQN